MCKPGVVPALPADVADRLGSALWIDLHLSTSAAADAGLMADRNHGTAPHSAGAGAGRNNSELRLLRQESSPVEKARSIYTAKWA